jgi:energy-coupling factor transporter ATP-binding protein EcfA2
VAGQRTAKGISEREGAPRLSASERAGLPQEQKLGQLLTRASYENLRNGMYISNFEVSHFKSFRTPGALEFKPGFNVITGQNSAGKTALLEALTLQFEANPHRSLLTVPVPGTAPVDASSARITFVLTRDELLGWLGGVQLWFPMPVRGFRIPSIGEALDGSQRVLDAFGKWLLDQPEFRVRVRSIRPVGRGETWIADEPGFGLYRPEPVSQDNRRSFVSIGLDENGGPVVRGGAQLDTSQDVSIWLANQVRTRIYRFSAERFSVGQCSFGNNRVLAPNAQNLPEVLDVLQANPTRFLQLNELLREILPQIQQVSVRPLSGNQVQAIVWPHSPNTAREDLAVPLNQCGSGVGQVLAILYVVMTADHPRVILVDEPQSFLHPGAVRKLVEVLSRYPQHQYILASHSPTVIMASDPATLTVARIDGFETSFQSINPTDSKELQFYLAEIGARLSDVFGADNILWVEGQTEEQCFPLILRGIAGRNLMGTAILGIRETGDLERRDAKRVIELYRRLTSSSTLLPPAVAFVLDKECRTDQQMGELQKMSSGLATFLPRRMYENYLLNPSAIASVVNGIGGFRPQPVSVQEVRELIEAKRQNPRLYCNGGTEIPADWVNAIDGTRVLREIFQELSEARVAFAKPKHSVAVTEWLIKNEPEQLRGIADMLVALLDSKDGKMEASPG